MLSPISIYKTKTPTYPVTTVMNEPTALLMKAKYVSTTKPMAQGTGDPNYFFPKFSSKKVKKFIGQLSRLSLEVFLRTELEIKHVDADNIKLVPMNVLNISS